MADALIKIGDGGEGPNALRDGDVIKVYTDIHITQAWSHIPKDDPVRLLYGDDETRMPMSPLMLKRFLVVSLDGDLDDVTAQALRQPVMKDGKQVARKGWQLPVKSIPALRGDVSVEDIDDRTKVVDLRATRVSFYTVAQEKVF